MKGQLFTQFFLSDGIRTTPEWGATAPQLAAFHAAIWSDSVQAVRGVRSSRMRR